MTTTQAPERGPAMTTGYIGTLTTIAAIGAGLAAGVFLAFSTFVMTAIRRLPAADGVAAMQAVNRAAPNPLFMLVLLGTAALAVIIAVNAGRHLSAPGAGLRLAGAVLYLLGILLTITYHVPHNDALALLDPRSASTVARWPGWAAAWTAWNHVRALTSLGGTVCFVLALRGR